MQRKMNIVQAFLGAAVLLNSAGYAMQPVFPIDGISEERLSDILHGRDNLAIRDLLSDNSCNFTAQHYSTAVKVPEDLKHFIVKKCLFFSQREYTNTTLALEQEPAIKGILESDATSLKRIWQAMCSKPFRAITKVEVYFVARMLNHWQTTGYPDVSKSVSLELACYYGCAETTALLLAGSITDLDVNFDYALVSAIKCDHAEVVKVLISDGRANPATDNDRVVRWASNNGYAELVQLLLANPRVNPAAEHNQALKYASIMGHTDVVELLLANKHVNPADDNSMALFRACANGHTKIVKLFLKDLRADPGDLDNRAIIMASFANHVKVAKLLLADGRVNPAAKENEAFIYALKCGRIQIATLLYSDKRVSGLFSEDQVPDSKKARKCYFAVKHLQFAKLLATEDQK